MLNWLKWRLAGKELRELEQWRRRCAEHIKWLDHDFPQVGDALRNLQAEVTGTWQLSMVRDQMRQTYLAEHQGHISVHGVVLEKPAPRQED